MKKLSLLDQEILRLKFLVHESDKRLEYYSGPELTRENYHNGNLHLQIRKLTVMANKDKKGYYCSMCGERFDTSKERVVHVMMDHERR